jgi:SpoVK/Ycf46/Vps4 family AAA+-type ATPase
MENLYTWDDFIAPAEVKKQLYAIEKMFRDFEKARQLGLAKALNVMFYGPPGTGKTFAAKVLASQVNADFKAISSGELKQGIIGETERKIRELFEWLKSGSARILFIDEAESLFMSRQNSKHEYTLSVVNQFLSELQGFNETTRGQYAVIISTNHPEMLDPAVLSRFSLKVHFELPGLEERKELFIKKLKGIKIKDIDINILAKLTKGYSGRDIENMIQNAKRNAFIDDRDYLIKEDFEILRF